MDKEYKILCNVTDETHCKFDEECKNINTNFRNNPLMRCIVQNCSKESGMSQYEFIYNNYNENH